MKKRGKTLPKPFALFPDKFRLTDEPNDDVDPADPSVGVEMAFIFLGKEACHGVVDRLCELGIFEEVNLLCKKAIDRKFRGYTPMFRIFETEAEAQAFLPLAEEAERRAVEDT